MRRPIQNGSAKTPSAHLKWRLVGLFGNALVDVLFKTLSIESVGLGPELREIHVARRMIAAAWHSRILLLGHLYRGWDGVALVSRSEDGEIIARMLQRQGQETVRGSTSRGGARALARMVMKLRERNRVAVIIPDGPRGPRFRVQPGIIALAAKTGYPIVPMTYSARRMKVFNSWDRFILPAPFTRCRVVYGRPLRVPPGLDRAGAEAHRKYLEDALNAITRQADARFGHRVF